AAVDPDQSDTVSIYADWQGTGDFDEVDEGDDDGEWHVNSDGTISFTHLYDVGSPAEGFAAVIRLEDEGGQGSDTTLNLVVRDVPSVLGSQMSGPLLDATPGQMVWAYHPDYGIHFTQLSSAHADGRTFHWIINNQPEVTSSLPVLDLSEGIYQVQAF